MSSPIAHHILTDQNYLSSITPRLSIPVLWSTRKHLFSSAFVIFIIIIINFIIITIIIIIIIIIIIAFIIVIAVVTRIRVRLRYC